MSWRLREGSLEKRVEILLRQFHNRPLPSVLFDWTRRRIVPTNRDLVRVVLAIDEMRPRQLSVPANDGSDAQYRAFALVCDDTIPWPNAAKGPDLSHPLVVVVLLGGLCCPPIKLRLIDTREVAQLWPSDRRYPTVPPFRPTD